MSKRQQLHTVDSLQLDCSFLSCGKAELVKKLQQVPDAGHGCLKILKLEVGKVPDPTLLMPYMKRSTSHLFLPLVDNRSDAAANHMPWRGGCIDQNSSSFFARQYCRYGKYRRVHGSPYVARVHST